MQTIVHPTHPIITSPFLFFLIIKKYTLQKSPVKSGFFLSHHLRPKKHTNTLFTYKDTIILLKSQSSALLPPNPPNPSPNHHPPRHIRNQIQTKSTLHVHFSFQSRPNLITPPSNQTNRIKAIFRFKLSKADPTQNPFLRQYFPHRRKKPKKHKRMHRHACVSLHQHYYYHYHQNKLPLLHFRVFSL